MVMIPTDLQRLEASYTNIYCTSHSRCTILYNVLNGDISRAFLSEHWFDLHL
jgi:hypothetical protein